MVSEVVYSPMVQPIWGAMASLAKLVIVVLSATAVSADVAIKVA